MSETDQNSDTDTTAQSDRRSILQLAAAIGTGALGFAIGTETTEAQTNDNTVASRSTPAELVVADRLQLVDISDPSSPEDGDMWYNSS